MLRSLVFFLLVSYGAAVAQEGPDGGSAPEDTPAIPLLAVTPRAEELAANLRRIQALAAPEPALASIDAALEVETAALAALRERLDRTDATRISVRMLEDQQLEWVDLDAKLSAWMNELQQRWKVLTGAGEELDRARTQWTSTREAAGREGAPEDILAHIDAQLTRVASVDERVEERAAAVGAVLARVSQAREVAAEGLERLSEIATEMRGRLWIRDAPSLWRLGDTAERTVVEDAGRAQRYWIETLDAYFSARRARSVFLVVCFVFFLSASVIAWRRSRSWPERAELAPARFVVSRPLSTAVAFTLVVTTFVLDRVAGPVDDVIVFLAVVPLVRLGAGLVPVPVLPALYGGALLLLLNRVWQLAPDGSPLGRVLLFIVTGVAVLGMAALVARWRAASETKAGGWWRLAWLLLLSGLLLSSVSLAADFLGWSNLSQTLTDATLGIGFGALAWTSVVLALRALVPVAIESALGDTFSSLRRNADLFSRAAFVVASALALVMWSRALLRRFQLLEPFTERLTSMLSASASVGGLEISAGRIVGALILVVATWLAARFVRFALREEILPRLSLPVGADYSIVSIVTYVTWASGLVLAGAAAGLNATQLTVVFGALGVGIGFGLQNIVSNFVSGLILIFERPIKVGDRIQTADYFGTVTGIGIRASTIRTFDGAEVVVPNGDLVSREFVNWTRTDSLRRVDVRVRVAHGTDPETVIEILNRAAREHEKVLENPAPSSFMTGFGDVSLDFRLLAWVRVEDFLVVASDLHVTINEAFERTGIELPKLRELRSEVYKP